MITAAIPPAPTLWRRRVGVAVGGGLAIVAIVGGMSAGLAPSDGWASESSAGVIPEVLYLEEEVAKIATIARVNGDIAREVTVDTLTSDRPVAADRGRPAPTVMNEGPAADPADGAGATADDHGSGSGAGPDRADTGSVGNGNGSGSGNSGGDSTGETTDPTPTTRTPKVDEPTTPTTTAPTETTTPKGPQNDKPPRTDGGNDNKGGGKSGVDAKSGTTTDRTEVTP